MFCYKCGNELPVGAATCPECDSPIKRKQRVLTRMILGFVVFIIGVLCGIQFDRTFLKNGFASIKQEREASNGKQPSVASDTINTEISNKKENTEKINNADSGESKVLYDEARFVKNASNSVTVEKTEDSGLVQPEKNSEKNVEVGSKADDCEVDKTAIASIGDCNAPFVASDSVAFNDVVAEPENGLYGYVKQRIVYKDSVLLESGDYNSYHGIISANGELMFSSDREKVGGKKLYQCFVKKIGDKKASRLFEWKGNVWTPEPVLKTDKVVFSSDSAGNEHIFLYDRQTKESRQLTFGKNKNMMPTVSPDGSKILFVSNRNDGINHIWLMNSEGQGQTQLTSGKYEDREPRWADAGKSVIFTRIFEKLKKSHILKLNIEQNSITPIVETTARNWMADVSPNGQILAYTRSEGDKGSKNSIVLRDMNTGDEQLLQFQGRLENLRPVWSPDSMNFVYHSIIKSGRSLYMAVFELEKN